jgi:hypothetical protein
MNEQIMSKKESATESNLEKFFKNSPDQRDVLLEWNNSKYFPGGESIGLKKRYQKNFGENNEFEYVISTQENNKIIEKIIFELAQNNKNISEFTLNSKKRLIDESPQIVWDLEHRIARTKNENISGSDIYKWIENYLKILIKNKKIENHTLFGEISQPKVAQWFLKNNYNITGKRDKIIEELNNSKIYSLMPVQIKNHDYPKDPYWIPNDTIKPDSEILKKYDAEVRTNSADQVKYLYLKNEFDPESLGCPVISVTKKIA